ncbi:alpha/beta fold hydrolase [Panacagrimonas sp.]|uniref:alpha/beta fold hydrolase n=1 Tax=Panacagrimonas sp. TaxID=2480088 RepID=UPI003B52F577
MPHDSTTPLQIREVQLQGHDGQSLAAEEAGDPCAVPVILLHGGGQTRHAWAGTALRLAEAGYYALAYDARGHGDSAWSEQGDYSPDALIGDLHQVVAGLARPPILVGASMGGLTSMVALGEAERGFASALVLVDIAARLEASGVARVLNFMSAHTGGFASLDEVVDAVAAYNPHRPRPSGTDGLRKNLRYRDGRWYWHWDPRFLNHASRTQAGEALVQQERRETAARRIHVPTLLVRGGSSDVVSPEGARALQELIPHAELADVAEAGHMVAGDRNDLFSEAVIEFLRRHVPPRPGD